MTALQIRGPARSSGYLLMAAAGEVLWRARGAYDLQKIRHFYHLRASEAFELEQMMVSRHEIF